MGETGKGIFRDNQILGLAPGGIAAARHGDGGVARVVGVGLADGQVHALAVGRETAGTLVHLGVQFRVDGLGLAPFALVVFL